MNFRSACPLLLILVSLFINSNLLAQCSPNLSYTIPGLYPDPVPNSFEGLPYDEVIDFVLVKDTVFLGNTIIFDSIEIVSISGLPPTFTTDFNDPDQTYPGGGNGCVRVQGNPPFGSAGTYVITFDLKAYFQLLGSTVSESGIDEFVITIQSVCSQTYKDSLVGIYPSQAPDAFAKTPYEQNMTLKLPDEILDSSIAIQVDSSEILGVDGLPSSFYDSCYASPCIFPGGELACIAIKGNPKTTDFGNYDISIYTRQYLIDSSVVDDTIMTSLQVNYSVGVEEKIVQSDLKLNQNYPNPFDQTTRINIRNEEGSLLIFRIVDLYGRVVEQKVIKEQNYQFDLDASLLAKGVYFYSITDGKKMVSKKMMKY